MKAICFIVGSFPNTTETFVVNQVIETIKAGYNVNVLSRYVLNINQSSQLELLQQYNVDKLTIKLDNGIPKNMFRRLWLTIILNVKYFKYLKRIKGKTFYSHYFIWPFKLHFYSQFKYIDVFHVHFAKFVYDVPFLKSIGFLKGKLIITFHGYDAHFSNKQQLKKLKENYKCLFKNGDAFTVNTTYLKNKVLELGCNSELLFTIPMGIDLKFFNTIDNLFLPKEGPVKLISIGRLIPIKGHSYAIDAIKVLKEKGYKLSYTIIGEGELYNELTKKIKTLDLEDEVNLIGRKTQHEIKEHLKNTHIFLMSSVSDHTGRKEAQGVVTIEAQAMGLPVVAFNSGGVPYTIEHNRTGLLVDEKNVQDYANAIELLIKNPETYSLMSSAARSWVEKKFSNKVINKAFFKLYEF